MSERHFALSDVEYDLITTLSNMLQAEDALHTYVSDAEEAGDQKSAQLFREIHDTNRVFSTRLRECLHDQFMKQ